jgi:hypothetical protein
MPAALMLGYCEDSRLSADVRATIVHRSVLSCHCFAYETAIKGRVHSRHSRYMVPSRKFADK